MKGRNRGLAHRGSDFLCHAFHLVENAAGLYLAYPIFHVTLALTLANLQGLFCDRLVRKYTNPDLAATFYIARWKA